MLKQTLGKYREKTPSKEIKRGREELAKGLNRAVRIQYVWHYKPDIRIPLHKAIQPIDHLGFKKDVRIQNEMIPGAACNTSERQVMCGSKSPVLADKNVLSAARFGNSTKLIRGRIVDNLQGYWPKRPQEAQRSTTNHRGRISKRNNRCCYIERVRHMAVLNSPDEYREQHRPNIDNSPKTSNRKSVPLRFDLFDLRHRRIG
jgi:hypothetical protein